MTDRVVVMSPAHSSKCTAVLSYWYKAVGEAVTAGEDLLDYETDKATVTLEAPATGVLAEIAVPEDGVVEPDMVLGSIEPAGPDRASNARSVEKNGPAP